MGLATHLYAIGIGSNRSHGRHGRPPAVAAAALAEIDRRFGLLDASSITVNPAAGGAGRDFANAVALVESALQPEAMLAELKAMEQAFGRRRGRRWAPRVLDLDILAWSGRRHRSLRLTIPHPLLKRRMFALGPLASSAPDWRIIGPLTPRHLAARLARRRGRG